MALDAFILFVGSPYGLIAFGVGLFVMMATWRNILGRRFAAVSFWPLLLGIVATMTAALVFCTIMASVMYTERLAAYPGLADFWAIVPSWALYLYSIYAVMLLFVFTVVLVPYVALLVRRDCFTWKAIVLSLFTGWLLASIAFGSFPANQWQQAHRLEHLARTALDLAWVFWLILGPFFATILLSMRWRPGKTHEQPDPT